ncbi:MAG: trigger factor [Acidimicrobiia bacterium]
METVVEELEDNKVRLTVAVPAGEFEKAVEAASRKVAREVRVPGFRPGKAPRRVIEARLGIAALREQALRDAVPDYYEQAVAEEGVDPIAPPEFDILEGQEGGDVRFDAVVQIRPVILLEGYTAIKATIADPAVTAEMVDTELDRLRDRFAELEDSATPLGTGDYAQLNVRGYVHDEEVEGLSATDFLYEVGSGVVVARLDEEIVGKRPGDILRFNDTLGERFGDRAGQEVAFQVLVKEAKRKILPEVTDEWTKDASEFETAAELRESIRSGLERLRLAGAHLAVRDEVLEGLARLIEIEAPEPLVKEEMERRVLNLRRQVENQGATLEGYIEATGTNPEALLDSVRVGAIAAVKADLALRAVVAQEDIAATDEDVQEEIDRMAQRAGRDARRLRQEIEHGRGIEAVRSDVARGKALRLVIDRAFVVDETGRALDMKFGESKIPVPDEPASAGEPEEESEA